MAGAELEQASEDAEEEEGVPVGRQRQQSARAGSRHCCEAEMRPATPTSGRIMTMGSYMGISRCACSRNALQVVNGHPEASVAQGGREVVVRVAPLSHPTVPAHPNQWSDIVRGVHI